MIDLDDTALRGAALLVKAADRDVRATIGRETRARIGPRWTSAINARLRNSQDRATFRNPKVTGSNPPTLTAATSSRRLTGGLVPSADWPWLEFGSGGPHARRGQLPHRFADGRVIYPASVGVIAYATRVWVDVIFDAYGSVGEVT